MKNNVWLGYLFGISILRILFFPEPSVFEQLATLSEPTRVVVTRWFDELGSFSWFYKAFLLGHADALNGHFSEIKGFFVTGLFHLLVVSGAHLHALASIVKISIPVGSDALKRKIILFVLLIFCALNGFQATCSRALLFFTYSGNKVSGFDRWILLFLVIVTLSPEFLFSFSFHLSMICALGIIAVDSFFKSSTILMRSALHAVIIPCLAAPLLFQVQSCQSWIVFLANSFALPIFEFFLMPITLLSLWTETSRKMFETGMSHVFLILNKAELIREPQICLEVQKGNLCHIAYLFFSYFFLRLLYVHKQRNSFLLMSDKGISHC